MSIPTPPNGMVSNTELILRKILGEDVTPLPPNSRVEFYLVQVEEYIERLATGATRPIGETTTPLTDGATTNPIQIDGESYTAQINDLVFYGNKEFLFTVNGWREVGDITNLNADMIDLGSWTAGTATTHSTPASTDTVLQALQKIDNNQRLDETNILSVQTDVDTLNHNSRQKVNLTITNGIYDRWNNLAASTGKHANIAVTKGDIYYYEGYKYTNDYPAYLLRKNGAIVSYYNGVSSGLVFGNLKIEIPDGVDELIVNSNNYVMELERSVTVGTMPNSNWIGRKAVWFGTSIPETSTYNPYLGYPEYVAMKLGLDLTNEARGSSCARRGFRSQISESDPYGWTGMGYKAAFYNMGSTIAEKQDLITNWDSKWKALVDPTHTMTQSDQTLAMHYTYENIIPEYINNGTELFIFDHGYNDWKNNATDKSADENDFYNRSTYQGAMATMIKKIYELNPNARVLLISHYDGQQKAGLIDMQKDVAEAWQLPLCRLDTSLGWAYDRHVSVYGQWASTSGGYWWKSSETANDFSLLALNVPDSIHPNLDLRGHAVKAIGEVIAKWINSNVVPFQ